MLRTSVSDGSARGMEPGSFTMAWSSGESSTLGRNESTDETACNLGIGVKLGIL